MPKALRSTLAVLAGYMAMAAVIVVLTFACIAVLHLQSGHPTPGYLAFNVVYSLLAALLGGWVAAKLAGRKPLQHGIALALLILVIGGLFLLHPAPGQPLWHQWLLTLLSPVSAVGGAYFAAGPMRMRAGAA